MSAPGHHSVRQLKYHILTFHVVASGGMWISQVLGSSEFVFTENPVANLTTPLRTDCSFCVNPELLRALASPVVSDELNHCVDKSSVLVIRLPRVVIINQKGIIEIAYINLSVTQRLTRPLPRAWHLNYVSGVLWRRGNDM